MEEAERLADRSRSSTRAGWSPSTRRPASSPWPTPEQRLRFRPSVADRRSSCSPTCPRSAASSAVGPVVVVTGTGNLVQAVTSVLARHQIVANDLRIEQAGLDDAYIALTGRRLASCTGEAVMNAAAHDHRRRGEAVAARARDVARRRSLLPPSSSLVIGIDLRAAPARPGTGRPALHRPVRPVDARASRLATLGVRRCRSGSRSTARRASCGGCRRRLRARRLLLVAQLVINVVVAIVALAPADRRRNLAFAIPLPQHPLGLRRSRSCSAMSSLFALGAAGRRGRADARVGEGV